MDPNRAPIFYIALGLSLGLLVVLLPLLGSSELGGSSEAREAHIMQSMLRDGTWLFPTRNDLLPSKPPLVHWMGALIALALGSGITEFFARLPGALCAAGLVLLLAVRLFSAGRAEGLALPERQAVAILGTAIAVTSYVFAVMLVDARVDMVFAFFQAAAIMLVLGRLDELGARAAVGREILSWADFALFYALCGLAVLAKGPLGIILPAAVVLACSWISLGFTATLRLWFRPRLGWCVFLLLVLPWYLAAAIHWRESFILRQIVFENAQRFGGGEHINAEPWWFYFVSFMRAAFPWSVVFFGTLLWEFSLWRHNLKLPRDVRVRGIARQRYLVWFALGFLMFSLSSGKRHSYLMPLVPAYSIFIALSLHSMWRTLAEWQRARSLRVVGYFVRWLPRIGVCLAVTGLVLQSAGLEKVISARGPEEAYLMSWLAQRAYRFEAALVIGWLVAYLGGGKGWQWRAVGAVVSLTALLQVVIQIGLGVKYHLKGFRAMASELQLDIAEVQRVGVIRPVRDEFLDPLLFYLNRRVEIWDPASLGKSLCPLSGQAAIIGRSEDIESHVLQRDSRVSVVKVHYLAIDRFRGRNDRAILLVQCDMT